MTRVFAVLMCLSLGGCVSWMQDFSVWCRSNVGPSWWWLCEVDYARDARNDFLSHDHERERPEPRGKQEPDKENGYD